MINLSKSYEYFQPEKHTDRVHIIGVGSVGSTIAELLARTGLTKVTLWDFDKVEPHNIANQMFFQEDIGKNKVDAVREMYLKINPRAEEDLKVKQNGWQGEILSGYVFLAVDNIDLRRQIVEQHMNSVNVVSFLDIRTELESAQHYAADWKNKSHKDALLASMQFSHEEASEAAPVSACNVTLSVAPTIRIICSYAVANFMNFWNGKELKKMILANAFGFITDAF